MTVPADAVVTLWVPFGIFAPAQSVSLGLAVAVQEVALVLDHVSVAGCPRVIELGEAEIVTVGGATPLPLPLPPPQLLSSARAVAVTMPINQRVGTRCGITAPGVLVVPFSDSESSGPELDTSKSQNIGGSCRSASEQVATLLLTCIPL